MPMSPPNYKALIITNTGWTGSQFERMASGIANGFTTYLTANPLPVISSLDSGAPGAGAGTGTVLAPTCSPTVLRGLLAAALTTEGIDGPNTSELSRGLSIATCTYLGTALTSTAHAGVGTGTGVGFFVGLDPTGLRNSILVATGFTGSNWNGLVSGISNAITTFLLSNVRFTIAIAGPAGPGAAAGAGTGRIY